MEEATELFALQQAMVVRAQADAARIARIPPAGTRAPAGPPPPPGSPVVPADDLWWMGALALGTGAGLLAALLRRAREPPAPARRSSGTGDSGEPEAGRR